MQRLACSICHGTHRRYGAGKRVRCTNCQRLIGSLCCRTATSWLIYDRSEDSISRGYSPRVLIPVRGTTCVECVPSAPKPTLDAGTEDYD
jgi:hypothetical protein